MSSMFVVYHSCFCVHFIISSFVIVHVCFHSDVDVSACLVQKMSRVFVVPHLYCRSRIRCNCL